MISGIFFDSPLITTTIKDLDARQLELGVGANLDDLDKDAVDILRIAAITSFAEMIGDYRVDIWFRPGSKELDKLHDLALSCFLRWRGYLDALSENKSHPSLDDILMFAVAGMVALRDHEVRDELRRPLSRQWLDELVSQIENLFWINQVRAYISAAILYIIRQENHDDIHLGDLVLQELAIIQKRNESSWIAERPHQKRDAATLLGFYHIAEAVLLTARFLVDGSVEINGKYVSDFPSELRRLLVKAEEFLQFSGDSEQLLWLQAAACALSHLPFRPAPKKEN